MNIKLQKVTKSLSAYLDIRSLYLSAFPPTERAPFSVLAAKAAKPNVDWWAIYNGDVWAGFFYIINEADLSYVFYFAIDEAQRGRGLGSGALAVLQRQYAGRRLFLAIEELDEAAENYQQRLDRKHFYLQSGFADMHARMIEGRVIYELLGIGGAVAKEEYRRLMSGWLGLWRFIVPTKILD